MRIVSLLADRQGKQSVFSPIHNLIGHKTTNKGHIVSHQEPTDIELVFFGLGELPFDFSSSMCSMIGETSCTIIPDDYIWHNSPIDANDPSGNLINFPYGYISVKVEI